MKKDDRDTLLTVTLPGKQYTAVDTKDKMFGGFAPRRFQQQYPSLAWRAWGTLSPHKVHSHQLKFRVKDLSMQHY